jgi:hypothetical protein
MRPRPRAVVTQQGFHPRASTRPVFHPPSFHPPSFHPASLTDRSDKSPWLARLRGPGGAPTTTNFTQPLTPVGICPLLGFSTDRRTTLEGRVLLN